ncbi:T9SS type A sorting domain-containing protein [uncultured Weeksella sp.]|uniref:T9SS type A sorting domain-containing protein n=1 Tax=uncultured Weeksella sp. TaxID=1161389 RepID=UPI00259AF160|nr:T9SS type A sorting domain-containing protein [uncultured Weeksella sp.]
MKKIFTLLSVAAVSVAFAQKINVNKDQLQSSYNEAGTPDAVYSDNGSKAEQSIIQYSDPQVFSDSTPLCQSRTPGEPVKNHDSRFFDLTTAGIDGDFKITKVEFATSVYNGVTFDATVAVLPSGVDVTADEIPMSMDDLVEDAYGSITVPAGQTAWHTIEFFEPYTIPAGSKFGAAVGYSFVNGGDSRAWFGNNDKPQTAHSYIGWPGSECVTDEGAISLASLGFPDVSWLLHVTGETSLGTVELGSSKLRVGVSGNELKINLDKNLKIAKVEIADAAGRVIPVKVALDGKVNISNLSKGVYFVRVQDNKGVTRISKFIK